MKNGFIYPLLNWIVKVFYYLNFVELVKFNARSALFFYFSKRKKEVSTNDIITVSNIAIDTYQLIKFFLLFYFWCFQFSDGISKMIIYYLLISNLFTYFYYHVWGSNHRQREDKDTLNRKFMNSILAIAFYLLCYGYLYHCHYSQMLSWPDNIIDLANSIYLSVSTAFTLTYGGFQPLTQEVRMVFMSELINTFLFFTIILSNSIPNHTGRNP